MTSINGYGNSTSDPLFVNYLDIDGVDDAPLTGDDGLRLGTGSPALGAGVTAGMPATDVLGVARTSPPDLGAYQGSFAPLLDPLVIEDLVVGTGDTTTSGSTVTVHYIGTLTDTTELTILIQQHALQLYNRCQSGHSRLGTGPDRYESGRQTQIDRAASFGLWLKPGRHYLPNSTLVFEIDLVSIPKTEPYHLKPKTRFGL